MGGGVHDASRVLVIRRKNFEDEALKSVVASFPASIVSLHVSFLLSTASLVLCYSLRILDGLSLNKTPSPLLGALVGCSVAAAVGCSSYPFSFFLYSDWNFSRQFTVLLPTSGAGFSRLRTLKGMAGGGGLKADLTKLADPEKEEPWLVDDICNSSPSEPNVYVITAGRSNPRLLQQNGGENAS